MTGQGRWNLRDIVDLYWTCGRLNATTVDIQSLTDRVLDVLSRGEPVLPHDESALNSFRPLGSA